MQNREHRKISNVLGEMSFRNGLGYAVFFIVVMLPAADAWQAGSDVQSLSNRTHGRSSLLIRNLPIRPDGRPSVREQMNRSWWPDSSRLMWLFGKTFLAVLGATLSLLILMPFRGCKRYALLFGPSMGIMVVTAVGVWLTGRTEIYRFEPVVIAIVAAAPTFALWYLCCKRSYERRGISVSVVQAELVE